MIRKIFLLGISVLSILHFSLPELAVADDKGVRQDLLQHPAYRNYRFDPAPEVIHIGSQPLLAPTGFITESMKRDRILHDALGKMGLTIKFYPFLKGTDINHFLKKGLLDGGVAGDMPTISFAATSRSVVLLPIQYSSVSLVTRTPLFLGEIKGKKIGYAPGSNAHFLILSLLSAARLKEEQVTLVPMDVDTMVEALRREAIFAFSAWEPIPEIALRRHGYVSTFKKLSMGFLYFEGSFAKSHSEALKEILAAELRAINWIKAGRKNLLTASRWSLETYEKLAGRKFSLSLEENAEIAKQDILLSSSVRRNYLNILAGGRLKSQYNFLKRIGKIPSEKNWEEVQASFNAGMLLEVVNAPHRYRLEQYDYNVSQSNKK